MGSIGDWRGQLYRAGVHHERWISAIIELQ